MPVPKGQHLWYDLITTDLPGAKDFYQSVIGWGTQPFEGGPGPYDMWTVGERPVGGSVELPEEARKQGAPPHWMAYIGTPDADATAQRAVELGATHLHTEEIPQVGKFAIIQDPFGAVFSAFQPAGESPPSEGKPTHGEFSWAELMTEDYEKAYAFYADLFGWDKGQPMDMGPMGIYQLIRLGDRDFGGIMNKPEGMPMSAWIYYVNVDDIDKAVEGVKANGGQVLNGPIEVPGGDRVAQCQDPQGGTFALHMFASA